MAGDRNRLEVAGQKNKSAEETATLVKTESSSVAVSEGHLPKAEQTVWEIFDEIWGNVPHEEFAKLPRDGAAQHDHYIYGTPKRA